MIPFEIMRLRRVPSAPPSGGSGRYWRVYITANNGASFTSLNEIEMRTTPGGPDQTNAVDAGTRASASSDFFGANGSRAFDDNTTDGNAWVSTNASLPQWIQWDFLTPIAIVEMAMWPESSDSFNRAPMDFELRYSDDGLAWTTGHAYSGITGWSAYGAGGGGYRTFSTV